jgi:hypothetical protein
LGGQETDGARVIIAHDFAVARIGGDEPNGGSVRQALAPSRKQTQFMILNHGHEWASALRSGHLTELVRVGAFGPHQNTGGLKTKGRLFVSARDLKRVELSNDFLNARAIETLGRLAAIVGGVVFL